MPPGLYAYAALAVAAGSLLPLQALINARLGTQLRGAEWAAMVNFAVGTVALVAFQTVRGATWPTAGMLSQLPLWVWVGGLLGAFFVTTGALAAPRLGAALFVALLVSGQMAAALLLDHFGVLHERTPITWARLAGALLLVAGVALIMRRP